MSRTLNIEARWKEPRAGDATGKWDAREPRYGTMKFQGESGYTFPTQLPVIETRKKSVNDRYYYWQGNDPTIPEEDGISRGNIQRAGFMHLANDTTVYKPPPNYKALYSYLDPATSATSPLYTKSRCVNPLQYSPKSHYNHATMLPDHTKGKYLFKY